MVWRFTERARLVVLLAREEARALGHGHIGTEHLLLALLREKESIAARVLESLGVTLERVSAEVRRIAGTGDEPFAGEAPFTARAKDVLEQALRETLSRGGQFIGPEEILIALGYQGEGVADRILIELDVQPEQVRDGIEHGPPPRPSSGDSQDALIRANKIRSMRTAIKHRLKRRLAEPVELVLSPPPELLTAKVFDILLAIPRFGRVAVGRMLKQCRISPAKTLGGLSERQRAELAQLLREATASG